MKKILVVGCAGKMGKLVFERLKNCYDVLGVDVDDEISKFDYCDLVVDFSSGENSVKTAMFCAKNKIPLIIGATGQSVEENNKIKEFAKNTPILKSSNFSVGVAIMKKMINNLKICDLDKVYIFEKHHKYKVDKPSGTAVDLEKYILKNLDKQAETFSIRAGNEIGEHSINFYFNDEFLSVSHQAFSRECFVDGVEIAVQFMLKNKKKKLFNFDEVLF